ncbi:MAG: type II and III secretion system protein, partial [gamma proteobacterium endosymbiont of Lamellibrachia anaximandri]|nr:type II and III secretion system protein [gamma proteobacterium endosymbiont of Lamellibrachia anaximandri]
PRSDAYFASPLAQGTPGKQCGLAATGDYQPSLRSPWLAAIEFLETGIILKVTPSVDQQGRILLDIHPEVSDGSVSDDGIPSKTTTQLSTRMLVPDGQTVFLGGLIKRNTNETREGVPILGDLPIVGSAFSNRAKSLTSTEVVVLITPQIVDFRQDEWVDETIERTSRHEEMLNKDERRAEKNLEKVLDRNKSEDEPELDNDGMWLLNQ